MTNYFNKLQIILMDFNKSSKITDWSSKLTKLIDSWSIYTVSFSFMKNMNLINFSMNKMKKLLKLKGLFNSLMILTFFLFIFFRIPGNYELLDFSMFNVMVMLVFFMTMIFSRTFKKIDEFLSMFIPKGCPLGMSMFVCLVETISYVVRPFVLILRPMIKLTMGCVGGHSMKSLAVIKGYLTFLGCFFIFFYEMFVCLVHWFMVSKMLTFSVNH